MPLLAPEVKGPISVCSQWIRIKGHIAGATIVVLVNGAEVASKTSYWPDDVVDVSGALNIGDKVTAVQKFGGESSPESPLPAIVQQPPTSLSHMNVLTHLHQCGTAVMVEGAAPGAEVKALINNSPVGSAPSIDGIARIKYWPGLNLSQTLSLEQTTCNNLSHVTVSPPADALPNPLPTPTITEPLIECMTAIKIGNVTDGATVTIYRDGVKDVSGAFDRSSLTWIGLKPLKEGELIEVDQAFMCRERREARGEFIPTHISGKASAKVQSAANLTKPKILSPICPDAKLITITGLIPSARVILYQDGKAIGMTDTPETTYSFSAPPLNPNETLTARMQLCDKDGPMSDPVQIKGDTPLNYLSVSRLFECASHIFIRNDLHLSSGKIVFARNKQGEFISAYHQVYASRFLLPVSPALVAGDEITIVVLGCNASIQEFGPYNVEHTPERRLPEPEIHQPVIENSSWIEVISMFAGAHLKVYVDNQYKAQAISRGDQSFSPVILPQPLKLGQIITATQSLCGIVSPHSMPATVVIPPPQSPQLIQPANNASGVSAKPVTLQWKDPGANTSAAAISYILQVFKGNSLVINQTSSSVQYSANIDYNANYTWKVIASNTTGSTSSASFSFKTEAEPAPEPPQQNAILKFASSLYASYDGITQVWPIPPNTAFYLCVIVANIGNATSDPFQIIFNWQGEGQSGNETINAPAAQPNWSDLAYLTFPNGLPQGQYYFEVAIVVNNSMVDYTSWGAWVGL